MGSTDTYVSELNAMYSGITLSNYFDGSNHNNAKTFLTISSGNTQASNIFIGSTGTGFKGARYDQNYSSNFIGRSIPDVSFVTGLTSSRVTSAIFNTYTGTTAPATYLSKTAFNTFSGTTAPAQFASKTIFNGYTGTTAPATFANKTIFNAYTASTKVLQTTFSTYTGTTAPAQFASKTIFNGYTGATVTRLTNLEDEVSRVIVTPSSTIALDLNSRKQRRFVITGNTPSSTFSFTNATNVQVFSVDLDCSGTIAIIMPSTVRMQTYEVTNSRWVSVTHILTLSAGKYTLSFSYDGTVYRCNASDLYV